MSDPSKPDAPDAGENFSINDVEITQKSRVYDGYFKIDRYLLRHRLHDGGTSGEMSREIFERGHAAAALLYDPDLDQMVFIEQFRAGAYAALGTKWFDEKKSSPWLLEIVAGIIDEGQTPEAVVKREAVEEADCTVLALEPICHYLVSPGGTSESVFLYCAHIDATNAGGVHGLDVEHEDIRVLVVDVKHALNWLEAGRFNNSTTLIAMQWFAANHEKLKARWSAA